MNNGEWILWADGMRMLRFRTLYECISYAEENNLVGCEIVGPALTTEENLQQLNTVKEYFKEDCGQRIH